uniref:Putative secreted protein n=1 Tax=Anopheles marajoara TaxID=58244 RepID=A0A2M4CF28_9DIPT
MLSSSAKSACLYLVISLINWTGKLAQLDRNNTIETQTRLANGKQFYSDAQRASPTTIRRTAYLMLFS